MLEAVMKDKVKKIIVSVIIVCGISYGISDYFEFYKTSSMLLAGITAFWYWYFDREVVGNSEVLRLEDMLVESDARINEQEMVLENYEEIFDNQVSEIECGCGKKSFKGLFVPKADNLIKCEECGSNYNIQVILNPILISEPMDNEAAIQDLTDLHEEVTKDIKTEDI